MDSSAIASLSAGVGSGCGMGAVGSRVLSGFSCCVGLLLVMSVAVVGVGVAIGTGRSIRRRNAEGENQAPRERKKDQTRCFRRRFSVFSGWRIH